MSFLLAHSVVSESIEDFWIWYAWIVLLVRLDGHERVRTFGDEGAVGEGPLLKESSLEANCSHWISVVSFKLEKVS